MINDYKASTSVFILDGFSGQSILTNLVSYADFDIEVFINNIKITDFRKYIIDNKIRVVFTSPRSGNLVVKRKASPFKITMQGHFKSEEFFENFYDALTQCFQDESQRRLETSGKQIGYVTDERFTIVISRTITDFSNLIKRLKSMFLKGANRIWRGVNSFGWKRTANHEVVVDIAGQSGTFGDWQNYTIEIPKTASYEEVPPIGWARFRNGYTPIITFSLDYIKLARTLYNPLNIATILGSLGTISKFAVGYYGDKKIEYDVNHTKGYIELKQISISGITMYDLTGNNTLSITIGGIQVPLEIGFYDETWNLP